MLLSSDKNIFGLDISDLVLRLIQIKKSGKKNIIISENEVILPQGIIVDGEIKKPDMLVKLIEKTVQTAHGKKIKTNQVISVLPETKTFIKLVNVQAENINAIPLSLEKEISKNIPIEINEIYYDWQLMEKLSSDKAAPVLLGVAPKKIVEDYSSALKKAKLLPLILEIEEVAIARCLLEERIAHDAAKIIIDFGAMRTGLTLIDHGTIQFSVSLPVSGIQITQTISDALKINWEQAEKAKMICGLDDKRCEGVLKKILFSTVDGLMTRIEDSIDFYHEHFNNINQIKEIMVTGGGANFLNLDKVLYERLKIPVSRGNPLKNVGKITKDIHLSPSKLSSYTTAIGLGLRALAPI